MLNANIVVRPLINTETNAVVGQRVAFLYPNKREFLMAAMALKTRRLLRFGENPIPGKIPYKAFFADLTQFTPAVYAKYAMLVRDFYGTELQKNFNAIFPGIDVSKIKASIHNPNGVMEANRETVNFLIEKYRNIAPLEFYDSRHPAEGIALMVASLKSQEFKGFINADDTGMAKTRQAIIASIEGGIRRNLVIAPKTARVTTWPDEIKLVTPGASIFLANHIDYESDATWTVIQWDLLRQMPKHFLETYVKTFDLLIVDEFHKAKHRDSQRSQSLEIISEKIDHLFGLTATPITKRPKDMMNLLRLIHHPIVKDEFGYLKRYCLDEGQDASTDPEFKGSRNHDELHTLLQDAVIRREKNQTNLPPLIRYIKKVLLTPEQRREYEQIWPKYYTEHREKIEANEKYPLKMVKFGQEKKGIARIKAPAIIEWAEEMIDAGKKFLIYTEFTDVYNLYRQHFKELAVGIDGNSSDKQREEAKRRFQTDPSVFGFIGNMGAASESLTLTASHELAIGDLSWLPIDQLQVEGRIQRGGATEVCSVYYFLCDGTADIEVFDDFVKSKAVVQTVTNRRDEQGQIHDPEWRGDTAGTSVEFQEKLIKADFDWSDVGEEPVTEQLPENIQRLVQAKGLGNARIISHLILYMKMRKLEMANQWHSPGDRNFGYSLIKWFEERVFYSPGQEDAGEKMMGRYAKELSGFKPVGLPSLPPPPPPGTPPPPKQETAGVTLDEAAQAALHDQVEAILERGRLPKGIESFMESVMEGYDKYGRFTPKQAEALLKMVDKFQR
jgi:hypothetical protein